LISAAGCGEKKIRKGDFMSYEENERLDQIEEQVNETMAVLLMMEFVLEGFVANLLSDSSEQASSNWRREFVEHFELATLKRDLRLTFGSMSPAQHDEIFKRSIEMAKKFVLNVAAMEDYIRAIRKRDAASPP
jgi:hypothetical protein